MKLKTLFKKELRQAIKQGIDNTRIEKVAGCTDRKIVLTAAEAVAGKKVWEKFMTEHLWNDAEFESTPSWSFGSPNTMLVIGLVPLDLAYQRLGLNRESWGTYGIIT